MIHPATLPPLAILGDLGLQELLVVALAAVMIFGRRLPEVAGRGFAQFQRVRRTLTRMWRETGIEDEMRRIQRDLDRQMPRDYDPASLARRETREIERRLKSDKRSQPRATARKAAPGEEPAGAPPAEARPPARTEPPAEPDPPPAAPDPAPEAPVAERGRAPE